VVKSALHSANTGHKHFHVGVFFLMISALLTSQNLTSYQRCYRWYLFQVIHKHKDIDCFCGTKSLMGSEVGHVLSLSSGIMRLTTRLNKQLCWQWTCFATGVIMCSRHRLFHLQVLSSLSLHHVGQTRCLKSIVWRISPRAGQHGKTL